MVSTGGSDYSIFSCTCIQTKEAKSNTWPFNNAMQWCNSHDDLENIILDHFGSIFSSSKPSPEIIDAVLQRVQPKVSKRMNDSLMRTYSAFEVTQALN